MGRALERCRFHYLPQLHDRTRTLVLGDGDGRFVARLLAQNPALTADAVDSSAAMISLLRRRCEREAPDTIARLRSYHAEALPFLASASGKYDLIVTHFLLDCLSQPELERLAAAVLPRMAPGALWLISDFRIPPARLRIPATMLVRCLYFAFRIVTGLRIISLPDHSAALTASGFARTACHRSLSGVLTAEIWQVPDFSAAATLLPPDLP